MRPRLGFAFTEEARDDGRDTDFVRFAPAFRLGFALTDEAREDGRDTDFVRFAPADFRFTDRLDDARDDVRDADFVRFPPTFRPLFADVLRREDLLPDLDFLPPNNSLSSPAPFFPRLDARDAGLDRDLERPRFAPSPNNSSP